MTKYLTFFCLTIFGLTANCQTFNLTVNNGYGSGNYQSGDTVHIWSIAYDNNKTFGHWVGDSSFLERPREWHTRLIMPNQNLSVTAIINSMPTYNIAYEQIMGVNNLKKVYHYFPTNTKGVIFFFHGTGGSASGWIDNVENRSLINASIADNYGIIVTEAEEITLNTDLNGDGKLRWLTFPIDTVNGIDYLNIKAITDTFINRGNIDYITPKFCVGMSNGGSFSSAISYAYNYNAGISYCASSAQAIFVVRNNPFAFRMAKFDDNAEVGPQGNYQAWQNDSILETRSICHDYEIHDRQPIYPERFARITGISIATSQSIFNDLVNNGQLNIYNYALHSDTIKNNILANPSLYPNIISLSSSLQKVVLNQIAASNAEHKFYSDYNYETLDFINNICSPTTGINDNSIEKKNLKVYPNPTNSQISLDLQVGSYSISIFNNLGQKIYNLNNVNDSTTIDVSGFCNGIYYIQATVDKTIYTSKFIKQ